MRYQIDHDFHIHSYLSECSSDPAESPAAILAYARENGMRHVVLTDHFWDESVPGASNWYKPQNYPHIAQALPLPQAPGTTFHFGCETDMDRFCTVGLSRANMDRFDFIVIPTTHLHMRDLTIAVEDQGSHEARARVYVEHFDALLEKDYPFEKIGLAHITCPLIAGMAHEGVAWEEHLEILDLVDDATYRRLFEKTARVGMGVELNIEIFRYDEKTLPRVLRPYFIARECGCRFYLGSDAHHPADLASAPACFARMVDLLDLHEEDKFKPFG